MLWKVDEKGKNKKKGAKERRILNSLLGAMSNEKKKRIVPMCAIYFAALQYFGTLVLWWLTCLQPLTLYGVK